MTKYITCKTWNNSSEQIVTHVGVDGVVNPINNVIHWIECGEDVKVKGPDGNITNVIVKTSSNGNKYLTTVPDQSSGNNIDNLPNC